jgi:hypothetical protein
MLRNKLSFFVMPGLVPGIHVFAALKERQGWPRHLGEAARCAFARP